MRRRMVARSLFGLALLFAASASAQSRMGVQLVSDPAVWRAFRPLVVGLGDGDPVRAILYMRASNRVLRKIEGNLVRDAPTQRFYDAASESFEELNLRELMALLPESEGDFRRFALQGQEAPNGYWVTAPRGAFEVNASSARRGFGDSSAVLRMRRLKGDDGKRYLVQWRSGIGVGAVEWEAIERGMSDAIALVEESVVQPAQDARPLVLRAADAFFQRTQPELGAEDRRVLAKAWASFPEVTKLLTKLGRHEDVIDLPRTHDGLTHLRLVSRFDLDRVEQHYPELADYLDDFGDLIDARFSLRDANGNTLLEVWLDSGRQLSRVEAYLRNGALVPTRAGRPLLTVRPDFSHMEAHVDLHTHAVGLHMYLDDLRVEMSYTATGRLTTRIRHTPGFRVEGRALGLIPPVVLDWFIPGDLPGLVRRMFDIATKGNEGQGVVIDYRYATQDGLATVEANAGVEVLDTALIRLGLSIIAERVIPDEAQSADLHKLWVAYRDAFGRDLDRFAHYGHVP